VLSFAPNERREELDGAAFAEGVPNVNDGTVFSCAVGVDGAPKENGAELDAFPLSGVPNVNGAGLTDLVSCVEAPNENRFEDTGFGASTDAAEVVF
jgi:hypothetical protein